MLSDKNKIQLRKSLGEIIAGFSLYTLDGNTVYLKHRSLIDDLETDFLYQKYFDKSVNDGFFTDEQHLEFLIKNGLWTNHKEKQIDKSQKTISELYENKRKVYRFDDIKLYQDQIEEEEKLLISLINERAGLCVDTAESSAQRLTDLHLLQKSIFKDPELKNLLYSEKEFDDLTIESTDKIFSLFKFFQNDFDEKNLKALSIQPFFTNLFYLSESIKDFFGVAISKLTHFQSKLITWGQYYQSIISNNTIPSDIRDDADKIEDWFFGKQSVEKLIQKQEEKGGNLSLNISKEEMKYYNLQNDDGIQKKLIQKIKESGGELSLDQQVAFNLLPVTERS